MRILVLGGSGRVGSGVVPALIGLGNEVSDFDIRPPRYEGARYVEGSIFDAPKLKAAMEEHDGIIAMVLHENFTDFEAGIEINVRGTWYILATLMTTAHRHLAFASTTSIHNERLVTYYHDESLAMDATYPYGLTKAMAEDILRYYCRMNPDLSAIALRLHLPSDRATWADFRRKGRLGPTTHSDVARAFDAALRLKDHKGFDAVFISGDPTGTYIDTTKAKNLLGWEALDRYPDEEKPVEK